MATYVYSPQEVEVLLFGAHKLTGYVEDTFINLTKDFQSFTKVESMDGKVSRTFRDSGSYTLTLTLAQSSPSNDILSKIWIFDQATNLAKFSILVKDNTGSTFFYAPTCWIQSSPDVVMSSDIEPRAWVFQCAGADINVGGNKDQGSDDSFLAQLASVMPSVISTVSRSFGGQ